VQDDALADRLVNYADAVVAAAFVGLSALSLSLGEPEIRCSMAQVVVLIALINTLTGVIFTVLLVWLRHWEFDLRIVVASAKVSMYSRYLHRARIAVVWFASIASSLLVLASATDSACAL
jgi:hypothetical protein